MATTATINGVSFDATATPTAIVSGYDRTTRAALTDDTLIKVRNFATKTNLPAKLSKGLQVSSYNPSDIKDPNNFFNFVSAWEATILDIETHLKTYFMETPFTLVRLDTVDPTPDQLAEYEFDLNAFLTASNANGGDHLTYNDGTTDFYRPNPPTGAQSFEDGGNILRGWHGVSLQAVVTSCELMVRYVNDDVDRQNLAWSFQYIMDSLDADLRAFVLSKLSHFNPLYARSGPVAFMIVAQRMLQTTENLAQKVINGFIALRLTHFEGENVIEAIFTLRNVLKFLRFGEVDSFAPRTTLVLLYDVFRGSTVGVFRAFIQQAQDIVLKDVPDPEVIFDHIQSKYEELLLADRWVPTKKKASVFVLGDAPKTKTYAETDSKGKGGGNGDDNKKKERPTHDKSGRKIDYTPPKPNEPHTRTRDGVTEYWCGKCARWGSHPTDKHDEWRKNFNKNRKKKSDDSSPSANSAAASSATTTSGSTSRGSVTFAASTIFGATTGLKVDPELMDGIDLD